MSNPKPKLVVIKDHIGKTIVGELVSEHTTDNTISLKNPASIILSQQEQTNKLQVQMFPEFFAELMQYDSRPNGTVWDYPKSAIVICGEISLDDTLVEQYFRMFTLPPREAQQEEAGNVINLFDEDGK